MRVIAGKYRHRALRAPRGLEVRPTSDRLRETLFNVLAAGRPLALAGTVWIDAFAGTGAVGIEALSRGARQVYFLENARRAAEALRANLKTLGIETGWRLLEQPAETALPRLEAEEARADFVFFDPPYDDAAAYAQMLAFLEGSRLLAPAAMVVAEHSQRFDPGEGVGRLHRCRTLVQGDAGLSFYKLAPAPR